MIYDIVITKLSEDDGGGYLGFVPDLSGCVSDGDTPTEALTNTQDAILDWIDVQEEEVRAIPEPGSAAASAVEATNAWREHLLTELKLVLESHEDLDGRIGELELKLADIQECVEHDHGWHRFIELTGVSVHTSKVKPLALDV